MAALTRDTRGLPPDVIKSLTSYLPQELAGHILTSGRVSGPGKRPVAVLFADMTGFTSLSETLDPEEILATMNHCLAPLVAGIRDYGGLIDKFIGDEIMALFGALESREDDCERAIRAALGLMDSLSEINHSLPLELREPLTLHIGINYGTVVVGNIGTVDRLNFTVMGDPVNLAARLVDRARPGEILVSEAVVRRTRGLFEFADLGVVRAKGKTHPIPVFRAIGDRRPHKNANRGPGDRLPFVGRLDELQAILAALGRALDSRGQVVQVIGEPGIGKTRLMDEIHGRPEAADFVWLEGRCQSGEQNRGYGPFENLFRSYFDLGTVPDGDSGPRVIRDRLRSLHPGGWKEMSIALGRILFGGRNDLEERSDRSAEWKSLFRSVARFFGSLSRERPLIVALEDCQWIDRSSAELLAYLIRHFSTSPIVFYLNRRDEKAEGFAPLRPLLDGENRERDSLWTVRLGGLGRSEGRRLLEFLTDCFGLPHEVGRAFLERSEGNPLFLEELVRSYYNREIDPVVHRGRTTQMDLDHVPATVNGLLAGRIDRLPDELRTVLNVASVIGRQFDIQLLGALVSGRRTLDSRLRRLADLGLIARLGSAGPGVFAFRHHLMRDVVYQHILKEQRTGYHARLAAAMVDQHGGRPADVYHTVAYHYERGNDPRRATVYYLKAAGRSRHRDAPKEAVRFLSRALGAGRGNDPGLVRSIRMARASLHKLAGDFERALEDYRWLTDGGNVPAGASLYCRALTEMGEIHRIQGRADQALICFARAVARAKKSGRPRAYAEGMNRMGVAAAGMGNLEEAEKYFLESLVVRRKIGDRKGIADCLTNLGGIALHRNDYDRAIEYNLQARQKYEQSGERACLARSFNNIGAALEKKGELASAGDHYRQSLSIRRRIGDRLGVAMSLSNLGNIDLALNDLKGAIRKHRAAIHMFRSLNHEAGEAHSLNGLGRAYSRLGEFDRSEEMFARALAAAPADLDLPLRVEIGVSRVLAAVGRGDRGSARTLAEEALALARKAGDRECADRLREIMERVRGG